MSKKGRRKAERIRKKQRNKAPDQVKHEWEMFCQGEINRTIKKWNDEKKRR